MIHQIAVSQARALPAAFAPFLDVRDMAPAIPTSADHGSSLAGTATLRIPDTVVGPCARRATVALTLSEPANRPL